jgi:hypothetical protein
MTSIGHEELSTWGRLRDVLRHLLLPVAVLVPTDISIVIRHVRASAGEVLRRSIGDIERPNSGRDTILAPLCLAVKP